MNFNRWAGCDKALLGPGDFSPREATDMDEAIDGMRDEIRENPEALIDAMQSNRKLAETVCDILKLCSDRLSWASASGLAAKIAPMELLTAAVALDFALAEAAADALKLQKSAEVD